MLDSYSFFFFQAEDGIRDLVRSRGLGDVYKRQDKDWVIAGIKKRIANLKGAITTIYVNGNSELEINERIDRIDDCINSVKCCLLYTSDAADERSSVDLGGRRIIKKKKNINKNR